MSPQHFYFSQHGVVLGETTGREYENASQILFFTILSHMSCVAFQMWKIRASPSQKWWIRRYLSHLRKIRTNYSQVWQIRPNCSLLWQIRLTFTFEWICHTYEEFARICHTCESFEWILHICDKCVRILHTSKIRICEKSYLLKSQNWPYEYFTHTKMWRIRANNSQRVKYTKCEY